MKSFFHLWFRSLPFAIGIALTLISLCFLVRFFDFGLEFDEKEIWLFSAFFLSGFPILVYGLNKLSD